MNTGSGGRLLSGPTGAGVVGGHGAPLQPPLLVVLAAIDALRRAGVAIEPDAEALVVRLFRAEGRSLVRLARLFVDDRDAAEDLVQEAFIRLARHTRSIEDVERAPAYLRSIVLNLARDHNRRGLVSLRHRAAAGREVDVVDDPADELAERLARDDRNVAVLARVAALPRRQRDCVTLRYLEGLSPPEIAATLGLSPNSVKTHLRRGLEALRHSLGDVTGEPP